MLDLSEHRNTTESVYLEKLAKGSQTALRYFYERYAGRIVAFANSLLGCREDAEDVAHTVFVNLWEQRAAATQIKSVDAYLYRMTRNATTDILRRRVRERLYLSRSNEGEETATTESIEAEIETDIRLLEAINDLPEPQRTILRLRHFEGLSYQQIAERYNISPHTVHYHISKALANLRNSLTGYLILYYFGQLYF